tara:strand:+ start:1415 stop:1567 length:153 start_codon:yes stop_codon:yes gene_type:complete
MAKWNISPMEIYEQEIHNLKDENVQVKAENTELRERLLRMVEIIRILKEE